jgi:hypothetical protein
MKGIRSGPGANAGRIAAASQAAPVDNKMTIPTMCYQKTTRIQGNFTGFFAALRSWALVSFRNSELFARPGLRNRRARRTGKSKRWLSDKLIALANEMIQ